MLGLMLLLVLLLMVLSEVVERRLLLFGTLLVEELFVFGLQEAHLIADRFKVRGIRRGDTDWLYVEFWTVEDFLWNQWIGDWFHVARVSLILEKGWWVRLVQLVQKVCQL